MKLYKCWKKAKMLLTVIRKDKDVEVKCSTECEERRGTPWNRMTRVREGSELGIM